MPSLSVVSTASPGLHLRVSKVQEVTYVLPAHFVGGEQVYSYVESTVMMNPEKVKRKYPRLNRKLPLRRSSKSSKQRLSTNSTRSFGKGGTITKSAI